MPTNVYLVRHAKAGDREKWVGDDHCRPLSKSGHRQATAIADSLLGDFDGSAPGRFVSSPFDRCRQTLLPLAQKLSLGVEDDDRLAEGAPIEDLVGLIDSLPANSVLCSHGDVIPAVIAHYANRGMNIVSEANWRKGCVWVLSRRDGEVASAQCWPPPDVK